MKNSAADRSEKAHKMLRENGYTGAAVKSEIKKAIHEHERHDHPGKTLTRVKFASGGSVSGSEPKHRMDKKSRGKKGDTHVNVIVAPPRTAAPGPMMPPPHPPMAGPPMGAAPRPQVLPPQGAPAAMPTRPPMGAPGMMNRGGRVRMTAGAGGGEGRLEKAEEEERRPRKKGGKC